MVINNAGLGTNGTFESLTKEQVGDLISVNVVHPTYLSKVAINYLEKREERSLLVNISTVMQEIDAPGYSIYAPSKAYIHHFADALGVELKCDSNKIDGMLYSPGLVATKLNGCS